VAANRRKQQAAKSSKRRRHVKHGGANSMTHRVAAAGVWHQRRGVISVAMAAAGGIMAASLNVAWHAAW